MAKKKKDEEIKDEAPTKLSVDELLKKYEVSYEMERASEVKVVPKVRTNWFALDYALDGGISQGVGGHLMEFTGKEHSGKTMTALKIIARYQSLGKSCVLITVEGYDGLWGEINGIDNKKLLIQRPSALEEAGQAILDFMADGVDLIVVDSLAMLAPKSIIEKDLDEKTRGEQAGVNTVLSMKISRIKKDGNTTIIFINQVRDNQSPYGDPILIPGGHALSHLYDTRLRFKQGAPIEVGSNAKKERIGFEIDIWCKKNKLGKPYRRSVTNFYLSGQIDNKETLLIQACKYGIIDQSGKWFSFNEKKYDGKASLKADLTEEDWTLIEDKIWEAIKGE